jgi:hypothetical protein
MTATAPVRGTDGRPARAADAKPRQGLFRLRNETMETIFGYAYALLMVDLLLVAFNAPLAAALFVTVDPLASWPFFLLLSLTLAPSLAGAFEVFRAMRSEGRARPFAAFWSGYRRRGGAAFVVGAATAVMVGLALFDATVMAGTVWAPLLGPLLAVLGIGSVVAALFTVVGLVVFPTASLRAIAKAAVYLVVRRWYFSVVALVMVGLIAAAVLLQPVLGAALVPGILLYAVFANAQYSFHRALEEESAAA